MSTRSVLTLVVVFRAGRVRSASTVRPCASVGDEGAAGNAGDGSIAGRGVASVKTGSVLTPAVLSSAGRVRLRCPRRQCRASAAVRRCSCDESVIEMATSFAARSRCLRCGPVRPGRWRGPIARPRWRRERSVRGRGPPARSSGRPCRVLDWRTRRAGRACRLRRRVQPDPHDLADHLHAITDVAAALREVRRIDDVARGDVLAAQRQGRICR